MRLCCSHSEGVQEKDNDTIKLSDVSITVIKVMCSPTRFCFFLLPDTTNTNELLGNKASP